MEHYSNHQGPGLIIVEATSSEGRLHGTQLGVFSDRHIDGLKKLADVIHAG